MKLTDRIALAIDFSEPSKVAARAAFKFARLTGAGRLTMIHAVRPVVLPAGTQPKVRERLEQLRARIHQAADSQLEALCSELAAPPELVIDHRIVEGHPAEVIPRVATEMQASLLLIGSHSRRGVRRWLTGSIAETLLEHTAIPTLVLLTGDDGVPPDAEIDDIRHVLIAIDDADQGEPTARAGFALARSFQHAKPKVVLLHVVEGTGIETLAEDDPAVAEYAQVLEDAGRGAVEALAARCDSGGLDVAVEVHHGVADEVILETARRLPARLVVVGTQGRGLASSILSLGSTAMYVVRHSDVSVLVVPHPEG